MIYNISYNYKSLHPNGHLMDINNPYIISSWTSRKNDAGKLSFNHAMKILTKLIFLNKRFGSYFNFNIEIIE